MTDVIVKPAKATAQRAKVAAQRAKVAAQGVQVAAQGVQAAAQKAKIAAKTAANKAKATVEKAKTAAKKIVKATANKAEAAPQKAKARAKKMATPLRRSGRPARSAEVIPSDPGGSLSAGSATPVSPEPPAAPAVLATPEPPATPAMLATPEPPAAPAMLATPEPPAAPTILATPEPPAAAAMPAAATPPVIPATPEQHAQIVTQEPPVTRAPAGDLARHRPQASGTVDKAARTPAMRELELIPQAKIRPGRYTLSLWPEIAWASARGWRDAQTHEVVVRDLTARLVGRELACGRCGQDVIDLALLLTGRGIFCDMCGRRCRWELEPYDIVLEWSVEAPRQRRKPKITVEDAGQP
ncbi:MAG TPA: hypothetical protein VFR11_19325 [Micromonosporaceae bacterium]|nr:hypothetical protein [Micromonosporaceae bacterium]